MKKMIVPIIIAVVMFAAAFGGTFYFYRMREAAAAEKVDKIAEESLEELKGQGKVTMFTARLLALVSARPAPAIALVPEPAAVSAHGAAPDAKAAVGTHGAPHAPVHAEPHAAPPPATASAPSGPLIMVPALVRYDMDLAAMKKADVKWLEEEKTLTVKVPPLIFSEPEFDSEGIRAFGAGGPGAALGAEAVADKAVRKAALGQLLQQARDDGPLRLAREASRKLVMKVFTDALHEEGVKAKVQVRFADEIPVTPPDEEHSEEEE